VLAGCDIVVPDPEPAGPAGDRYEIADLVGCRVEPREGPAWGVVKDVWESGGAAVLVLARPDGGEALVPLGAAICCEIDTAGKRILIDPPDGLWDLNEI